MEILATARHGMGGEFKLVKVSNDFYMYGTQKEFNSILGVSVDRCGTLVEVLNHCLSISELCKNNITKYKAEKEKSKKPEDITAFWNLSLRNISKWQKRKRVLQVITCFLS